MLADLIALIFPRNCINCSRSLIHSEETLCTFCKMDLPTTDDHERPDNVLYQKFAHLPQIKSARAFLYFQHRGVTQKLLHQLKYNGKKAIAAHLTDWFRASLGDLNVDLIIPVPLHKTKLKRRGYNQSLLLARELGDALGAEVKEDIIARKHASGSQTSKSRVKRWKSMENVYSEASENVRNKKVLIVDDVITTGATVSMLCEKLAEQNVNEIHIVAIARGK